MGNLHPLLKRQMIRHLGGLEQLSDDWQRFIEAVNDAYLQNDFDRQVLERSMELSSAELLQINAQLNAVLDNMADGLLVTDVTNRIIKVNPAMLNMFDMTYGMILGKQCGDVFGEDIVKLSADSLAHPNRVATCEVILAENRIGKALAASITKNKESVGGVDIGSIILVRDVTIEKEIDQMKTSFISMVSHELRTPLTSIYGFAVIIKQRLEKTVFPQIKSPDRKMEQVLKQVARNLEIIIAEGERLTDLINDILDISKMEAGRMEWNMESVLVAEVVGQAVAATTALFDRKGLQLVKEIEYGLPLVTGEKDRLVQVIINLLSNAVKFTDQGTVTCRAEKIGNEIRVCVIDTGIGIAPEDLDNVFEPFKQVGDTLTGKPRGTGLGLSICEQIIKVHGGRIWVESEPGVGSTFSFTLPVGEAVEAGVKMVSEDRLLQELSAHVVTMATTLASPAKGEMKLILVVDDEPHIRELLRQVLEAEGYRVVEAVDGLEAVELAKRERPDLITLDVMMPRMSGYDAAAILKNDPLTRDIPIIVISIVRDEERGYRIGVDRYMNKPVDSRCLLKEIGALLTREGSSKKVLVWDENESTVKTLTEVLEARGYHVVGVGDGAECIRKAVTEKPDMVIADVLLAERHNLVKTLRFEEGMERLVFFLLRKKNGG